MDEIEVVYLMTPDAPDVCALLAELVNRPAWHRQAACRGMGTEAFFPRQGESIDTAKAVCEGCTVRAECLAASLEHADCIGVWGGVSSKGRRVLRRGAA